MSPEELEKIKAEMCDKYCRFPFSQNKEYLKRKCAECPLNKLEVEDGKQS